LCKWNISIHKYQINQVYNLLILKEIIISTVICVLK